MGRLAWWGTITLGVLAVMPLRAQVFTVGEKTATADISTDFKATHVELPGTPMTERGRRDLVRNLEAEQGFAHRVLPLGGQLTLEANGNLTPGSDAYKLMVYKKGSAAQPGDRVLITALKFEGDRLVVDLNGGPYPPHRFMRHIQIGVGGVATPDHSLDAGTTGCRITLVFEGRLPEVSAPEVKALLEPLVEFGARKGVEVYADTLPAPIRAAVASHEVLVGMDRQMVLAAAGQPEHKMRETVDGERYEEWIYGHQPQPIKFVRFVGERVTLVKIAASGKAIEVHDHDELAGVAPSPEKTVAVGDVKADGAGQAAPPSLLKPGEATDASQVSQTMRKVQLPEDQPTKTSGSPHEHE